MFDSRQYEWADISIELGGRIIVGARGIKYGTKQEKEAVFGKGNEPLSIQHGNINYEGEITLLQSELETLLKTAGGSVVKLHLDAVVAYGNPSNGDTIVTDKIRGLEFTDDTKSIKQGDKFMEVTLPFIALKVEPQTA